MGWNHQLVDLLNACNSYRVSAMCRWYLGALVPWLVAMQVQTAVEAAKAKRRELIRIHDDVEILMLDVHCKQTVVNWTCHKLFLLTRYDGQIQGLNVKDAATQTVRDPERQAVWKNCTPSIFWFRNLPKVDTVSGKIHRFETSIFFGLLDY